MGDLQTTVEIVLDLGRLYNVDIFQRGFYWVLFTLVEPTTLTSKVEVHMIKQANNGCVSPSRLLPSGAVTSVVHVLRRKEMAVLENCFLFRIHSLVDSQDIMVSLSSLKFTFEATLCFSPAENWCEENRKNYEAVSKRSFKLNIDPLYGLHAYSLIMFEYMYMAAIGMTVHASVVALHQPLMSMPGLKISQKDAKSYNYQNATLESILYKSDNFSMQAVMLRHEMAIQLHTNFMKVLLSVYANMSNYFKMLKSYTNLNLSCDYELLDAAEKFKQLTSHLQGLRDKDDIINQVNMNLASTCSHLLGLWSYILDIVCLNRKVVKTLALENHHQLMTRLRSTVFTVDNPRKDYDENRFSTYSSMAGLIRNSKFFEELPPLSVELLEREGYSKALPIVFEDVYTSACAKSPEFFLPCDKLPPSAHLAGGQLSKEASDDDEDTPVPFCQDPSKLQWDSPWIGKEKSVLSQFDDDDDTDASDDELTLDEFLFGVKTVKTVPEPSRKFPDEISRKVCEEPDEFDLQQSNLLEKVNGHSCHSGAFPSNGVLFFGPGYVSSTKPEVPQLKQNVVEAFGVRSSEEMSAPSATTTLLSPEDEPDLKPLVPAPGCSAGGDRAHAPSACGDDALTLREDSPQRLQEHSTVVVNSPANVLLDDVDLSTQQQAKSIAAKSLLLDQLKYPGSLYIDIPASVPCVPYLVPCKSIDVKTDGKYRSHFIVFVHGLDGSANDLRLVRTYLQLGLDAIHRSRGMHAAATYLLSEVNERDTYGSIDVLAKKLVAEILDHISFHYSHESHPRRISFIGHSLGGLVIRAAITDSRLQHLQSRFHTFLSLSSPHLGSMFNSSTIVNTGMWLIQKWKKSDCLLQLGFKDNVDLRKTFLYKLSRRKGLEFFKNILLVASEDDRYVPYHSARIEMCKLAQRSKETGQVYQEMVSNTLKPIWKNPDINLIRFHVVHKLQTSTANSMIGRAAHIAVLDSEVFLEQFFLTSALKYFI